ncbi:MAG TPA: hypothetical protein PK211_10115 [Agitococcus sp.]|nr:hypothetical protein [Agitococcus sp.]
MDTTEFKRLIYTISQQTGATVVDVQSPQVTPNFVVASLRLNMQTFYILCSENNDWAFSQQLQPFKLQFIDHPLLANMLHNLANIQVYCTSQLNAPFVAQSWMSKHDINYWKPFHKSYSNLPKIDLMLISCFTELVSRFVFPLNARAKLSTSGHR